jgi:predicted proteasome-type protease
MTSVVDLLERRARRQEEALHFPTPIEALAYATEQVRELQDRAGVSLLLTAEELDLPLSQLAAVLDACLRLYTHPQDEENA